jgi:hypothetical protein
MDDVRASLSVSLLAALAVGGVAAPASAVPTEGYSIQIVGAAHVTPHRDADEYSTGVYAGTTVRIGVRVTCPEGVTGPVLLDFAAVEGTMFETPYLPAMTAPLSVDCTGDRVGYTLARTVARNQDPSTFTYFEQGFITVTVATLNGEATDTKRVRVVT